MSFNVSGAYHALPSENTVTTANDTTNLTMTDFFKLMIAQLKNQNMLNPTDSSEFIGQMAQFSTLSKMEEMSAFNKLSYAVSLIGKDVKVTSKDESGQIATGSGTVDSVYYDGSDSYVAIDGAYYLAGDVYSVSGIAADSSADSGT